MAAYRVTDTQLTALADAIRAKGVTEDPLLFPGGFLQAIGAIETGGGSSGSSTPAGYEILTGTATLAPEINEDDEEEAVIVLSVSNVPFTAEGAAVWHTAGHKSSNYVRGMKTLLFAISFPNVTGSSGLCYNYPIVGSKGNAAASMQIFQTGGLVDLVANAGYNGTYKYMIWGHAS